MEANLVFQLVWVLEAEPKWQQEDLRGIYGGDGNGGDSDDDNDDYDESAREDEASN